MIAETQEVQEASLPVEDKSSSASLEEEFHSMKNLCLSKLDEMEKVVELDPAIADLSDEELHFLKKTCEECLGLANDLVRLLRKLGSQGPPPV